MHISRVTIENMKGFKSLDLDLHHGHGELAGWTVLAGRNGSGKTTLLRSLALGVAGPRLAGRLCDMSGWLRAGTKTMSVSVTVTHPVNKDLRPSPNHLSSDTWGVPMEVGVQGTLVWRLPESTPPDFTVDREPELTPESLQSMDVPFWSGNIQGQSWFAAGYGATRRVLRDDRSSDSGAAHGRVAALASLFQDGSSLDGAITRLKGIFLRSLDINLDSAQRVQAKGLLDFLCGLLNDDLLPDGVFVERVDSRGLWAKQGSSSLLLEDLSDGFRIVAALVVDLVLQLSLDGHGFSPGRFDSKHHRTHPSVAGVVLIDEADLHLHVSWQQKLGFWLKAHFPNIQFIVTTHSPFICQAADLIIRLPPPNSDEPAAAASAEEFKAVINGSADDAVMSDLFGLESSRSAKAEERLTELARLERLVRKDLATLEEQRQYKELDAQMPASADVDRMLRSLERAR